MDEKPLPRRPRYGVYPLVGDQCQFDDELSSGNDKVAATLTARRNTKNHPLGVMLLDQKTGNGWVWRDEPALKGHPVQLQVYREDLERWLELYLRQHRQ